MKQQPLANDYGKHTKWHDPDNSAANEACEQIVAERDKLREALKPFALAYKESSSIGSVPDAEIWIWKPSDNRRETNGITRAHLKTAACLVGNVADTVSH